MTREIKITPPEGFEIDRENSTFECIKFKPIVKKRWRDNKNELFVGYLINDDCRIILTAPCRNSEFNGNVFATEKQAKSALAMARISQIMANDERFGGVVTDEEWKNYGITKWTIERSETNIIITFRHYTYTFLAFHTMEQRYLFLKENEDLVRDYLMID